MSAARRPWIAALALFVVLTAADQGSKQWARHALLAPGFFVHGDAYPACGPAEQEMARARFVHRNARPVTVVPHLFSLRYVENCSSAFNLTGVIPPGVRVPFLLLVSLLACVFLPVLFFKTDPGQRFTLFALPCILSGALGNLLDRMIYGYVIDFVDWYITFEGREYHWPTFNIADASIVAGIALMLWENLVNSRKRREEKAEK